MLALFYSLKDLICLDFGERELQHRKEVRERQLAALQPVLQVSECQDTDDSLYSTIEIECFKECKRRLEAQSIPISLREMVLTCYVANLAAEEAAMKYVKWLEGLKEFGFKSFAEAWGDIPRNGKPHVAWDEIAFRFRNYAACGKDTRGSSVFWVRANDEGIVLPGEEISAIRAGLVYTLAMHADLATLRQGVTFVIDIKEFDISKHKRNSKLENYRQSLPVRPIRIFILGANIFTKALINSIISVAKMVSQNELFSKISFADIDEVTQEIPAASLPLYRGGQGGGISTNEELISWTQSRLANFTLLPKL